jgi:arylsulfatase A-like enzyme
MGDNTLILFTTDHGLAFPGSKATLYDRGLGVMLIMRGPGGFHGGRVVDALVSHIDVYPTLMELAEIEPPSFLQGVSLLPLVRGDASSVREAIFAGMTWHAAYEPQRAIRTDRFKYIRRFGERTLPVLANCDDSPSKSLLLKYGWAQRPVAFEQLYDLIFDPNEADNLIDSAEHTDTRSELSERLERWMGETGDPLLRGAPEPPPGAEYNDPDQISASEPLIKVGGPVG